MNLPYTTSELSNGLRFLYIPLPQANSAYVLLAGAVGRRAEEDNEIGAAHFLEHLFFDGTKKYPTAHKINAVIEDIGASNNAMTSQELVSYYAKTLPEYTETACEFIADIFQNSLLADIEKERSVIAQEARFKRDDPVQALIRLQYGLLYPNQRIGRTIFDEDTNLKNMTEEIIKNYFDRTYVAENFALCIAGNVNELQAHELAEKYFSTIRKGTAAVFAPAVASTKKEVRIEKRDFTQAKLAMTFESLPIGHEQSAAANVLSAILGQGSTSRLALRLREELELVYHAGTYGADYSDTGYLAIITFLNDDKVQEATNEICGILTQLATELVTDKELERAKARILSRIAFASEDPAYTANVYIEQLLFTGEIKDISVTRQKTKAVTKEDVLAVAKKIFSKEPKVTVIAKNVTELDVPSIGV